MTCRNSFVRPLNLRRTNLNKKTVKICAFSKVYFVINDWELSLLTAARTNGNLELARTAKIFTNRLKYCKAQIPLGSTRLDTFDVSSPCILAVSS